MQREHGKFLITPPVYQIYVCYDIIRLQFVVAALDRYAHGSIHMHGSLSLASFVSPKKQLDNLSLCAFARRLP